MAEPLPIIVIVGPTAAGKTVLALARAAQLGGEIISADSVQVYRGLDIGSAKPTAAERAAVVHHLVDVCDPADQINAGAWVAAAEPIIADLHARGRVPIVAGGTGLYVRALIDGLAAIPDVPAEVQRAVRERLVTEGAHALHRELAGLDPETAARLAPNDSQRVARALEVRLATGASLSAFHAEHRAQRAPRYAATMVGVFPDRDVLERRIVARAQRMVDEGLVDEVRALLERGVSADAPGLRTMGYREVVSHLVARPLLRAELVAALALAHRRYAKRQITWWRQQHFDEHAG